MSTARDETPDEKVTRLRERLSYEQRRFCEEFIKCCDAPTAYRIAYDNENAKASTASQLLGRWYIQDYIAALSESQGLDDTIITKGETLAHLANILRDEASEDKDRIAAAKVISHVRGFGVKRVEHTGSEGGPIRTTTGLDQAQIQQLRADFLGVDPERLKKAE
jgi:phage terminase small subunit